MPKCNHFRGALLCRTLKGSDALFFSKGFYATTNKMHQDTLILANCSILKTKENNTKKKISIKYNVRTSCGKLVRVCQSTFCGLLNIKRDRVQRVCKNHFETGRPPVERRGGDRKTIIFKNRKEAVIAFICKLKILEVHYCRNRIAQRQYLSGKSWKTKNRRARLKLRIFLGDLSINKLYRMYSESQTNNSLMVKSSFFRAVFNNNFNIGFKMPSTDVCSTCLQFKEKMKLENDLQKKNELMITHTVHKRRANAFFKELKEEKDNLFTISFDCQKNMVLPKIPDQAAYYSRQFYLYNFGIVEGSSKSSLTTKNVFLYIWTENQYVKGSNQIASAVYHRLCHSDLSGKQIVRLVADGCGGQNKNTILMTMVSYWFLKKAPSNIKKIEIIFPVAGHSFMPPDRVFAKCEKEVKAKESIILPSEYIQIYEKHGTVIKLGGENCPVIDWKDISIQHLKPPGQWHFRFNDAKRFIFTKKNGIFIRGEHFYNSDTGIDKTVVKKGKRLEKAILPVLEVGINVKVEKRKDVDKLLAKHFGGNWRSNNSLEFYRNIIDNVLIVDPIEEFCEFQSDSAELRV